MSQDLFESNRGGRENSESESETPVFHLHVPHSVVEISDSDETLPPEEIETQPPELLFVTSTASEFERISDSDETLPPEEIETQPPELLFVTSTASEFERISDSDDSLPVDIETQELARMASTSTGFKGKGPYNKSLKAKVVAVEESPKQYKGNDGTDKSSLTSAISDGETVMKVVCYNATTFAKFKVGNTLVLREVIKKTDDSGQLIVVTKNSNVLISAPIEVPEEHVLQGGNRIKPEPSEYVEITKALGSPLNK